MRTRTCNAESPAAGVDALKCGCVEVLKCGCWSGLKTTLQTTYEPGPFKQRMNRPFKQRLRGMNQPFKQRFCKR
jgi:hypothetical protein